MQDVAHEADFETLDLPVLVADGKEVEQALRGMLVLAVAGVDDVGTNPVAQELGGARGGMADDHHVDPHRLEVPGGVDQGLPLLHRAAARRHVDRIGGETFFREFERDTRTRGLFEEQITMVLPRSAGTFLMGRSETSLKGSAVSRMSRIWSAERSSSPTRSLPRGSAVMSALPDAPGPPRRVRPAPRPARRPAPRCSP